jgi:DNA (cytosine-5)-methyltransferase 1
MKAVDLFCGAGGFTTGAMQAGVNVLLAVNHWRTAICTHEANHPETRHICARISDINVKHDRTLPDLDMILASPECTHHSIARGGRPINDQRRATPWNVLDWVEAKLPRWVIVENVREFRNWGPLDIHGRQVKSRQGEIYRQWVKSLEAYGYQVDAQVLNAADFGAATSRSRLFIVARRGRRKADIPWPEITHPKESWRSAYEIIDWSKPCPSIFSRKKPLADKTLKRIEIGLRKFVGQAAEPFIVRLRNNATANSIGQPLNTITTSGAHDALCVPFMVPYRGERSGQSPRSHAIDEPMPTITTFSGHALVAPYLLVINHGGDDDRSRSPREPIGTLTTKNGHSLVVPFLTKYYGTGSALPVDAPLDTITTRDRFGLAMVSLVRTMRELGVIDIGFRMLDVEELARAQGFPEGYQLFGNKADRVRQIGNSVSPPVARALCQTYAEAG